MDKIDHSLEVNNLVVEYSSGGQVVQAVNDVSFKLEEGGSLGLVGETGAGKTTIAKAIMSILPDPPAKVRNGEIIFGGEDLLKKSEKELQKIRGKEISMIFQDPMTSLNPVMKVGDQIEEVVELHSEGSRADCVRRAVDMLELVGITGERYDEYPHQFSGGMKQRVVIAMALACDPALLIADEPTTALDVTIQAQVLEKMRELIDQMSSSLILITHDLGVVAEMCEYVAVVYAGEIVEYGPKREIYKHYVHPYTMGLFNSVPNLKDDSPRLSPIPGLPPDPSHLPEGCYFHPRCPFATEQCRAEKPPTVEVSEGHLSKCFYQRELVGKETNNGVS